MSTIERNSLVRSTDASVLAERLHVDQGRGTPAYGTRTRS